MLKGVNVPCESANANVRRGYLILSLKLIIEKCEVDLMAECKCRGSNPSIQKVLTTFQGAWGFLAGYVALSYDLPGTLLALGMIATYIIYHFEEAILDLLAGKPEMVENDWPEEELKVLMWGIGLAVFYKLGIITIDFEALRSAFQVG